MHHHGSGQRANPVIGAVQNQQRLADLLLGIEAGHAEVGNQRREHWGQALGQRRAYNFARLDDNERVANEVVTGPFVDSFHQPFGKIRQQALPQQAVEAASVPAVAVRVSVTIGLVFLDQQARQGGEGKPLLATGRLSITAQRVDGRRKTGRRRVILIGPR